MWLQKNKFIILQPLRDCYIIAANQQEVKTMFFAKRCVGITALLALLINSSAFSETKNEYCPDADTIKIATNGWVAPPGWYINKQQFHPGDDISGQIPYAEYNYAWGNGGGTNGNLIGCWYLNKNQNNPEDFVEIFTNQPHPKPTGGKWQQIGSSDPYQALCIFVASRKECPFKRG